MEIRNVKREKTHVVALLTAAPAPEKFPTEPVPHIIVQNKKFVPLNLYPIVAETTAVRKIQAIQRILGIAPRTANPRK